MTSPYQNNPEKLKQKKENYFEAVNKAYSKELLKGNISDETLDKISQDHEKDLNEMFADFIDNPKEALKWLGINFLMNIKTSWLGEFFGLDEGIKKAKEKITESLENPVNIATTVLGGFLGLKAVQTLGSKFGFSGVNGLIKNADKIKNATSSAGGIAIKGAALATSIYGIAKLHEFFTNNPEEAQQMPEDKEKRREWWDKSLDKIGITNPEEKELILDFITQKKDPQEEFGKNTDNTQESIEKDGIKYERLSVAKDNYIESAKAALSPLISEIKGRKKELASIAFITSIFSETARDVIKATAGIGLNSAKKLLIDLPFSAINDFPILTFLGMTGIIATIENDPLIPKDPDELAKWLKETITSKEEELEPEIKEHLSLLSDKHYKIFAKIMLGIDTIEDYVGDAEKYCEELLDALVEKSSEKAQDFLLESNANVISSYSEQQLNAFEERLNKYKYDNREDKEKAQKTQELQDFIHQLRLKIKNSQYNKLVTKKERDKILKLAKEAGITIGLNNHDSYYYEIPGTDKKSDLFPNPDLDIDEQLESARLSSLNTNETDILKTLTTSFIDLPRMKVNDIFFEDLPIDEQTGIIEQKMRSGWMIAFKGAEAIIVGPMKAYAIGPIELIGEPIWEIISKGESNLSANELTLEYTDGLVSVLVFGTIKSTLGLHPSGKINRSTRIIKSLAYPLKPLLFGRNAIESYKGKGLSKDTKLKGVFKDLLLPYNYAVKSRIGQIAGLGHDNTIRKAIAQIRKIQAILAYGHNEKVFNRLLGPLKDSVKQLANNLPDKVDTEKKVEHIIDKLYTDSKGNKGREEFPKVIRELDKYIEELKSEIKGSPSKTSKTSKTKKQKKKSTPQKTKESPKASDKHTTDIPSETPETKEKTSQNTINTEIENFSQLSEKAQIKHLENLDKELNKKIQEIKKENRKAIKKSANPLAKGNKKQKLLELSKRQINELRGIYAKRVALTKAFSKAHPDTDIHKKGLSLDPDIAKQLKLQVDSTLTKKGSFDAKFSHFSPKMAGKVKKALNSTPGRFGVGVGAVAIIGYLAGEVSAENTEDTDYLKAYETNIKSYKAEIDQRESLKEKNDEELITEHQEIEEKIEMAHLLIQNIKDIGNNHNKYFNTLVAGENAEKDIRNMSTDETISYVNQNTDKFNRDVSEIMRLITSNHDIINELFLENKELQEKGIPILGSILKLKWDKSEKIAYLQYANKEDFQALSYATIDRTNALFAESLGDEAAMGAEVAGNFIPVYGSYRDLWRAGNNFYRGNTDAALKDLTYGGVGAILDSFSFGSGGSIIKGSTAAGGLFVKGAKGLKNIKLCVKALDRAKSAGKIIHSSKFFKSGNPKVEKIFQSLNTIVDAQEISKPFLGKLEAILKDEEFESYANKYYVLPIEYSQEIPCDNPNIVRMLKEEPDRSSIENFEADILRRLIGFTENTYWDKLDYEIVDLDTVIVKRRDCNNQITITRSKDGSWNLEPPFKADGGYPHFEQAFFMANLINKTAKIMDENEYQGNEINPFEVYDGFLPTHEKGDIILNRKTKNNYSSDVDNIDISLDPKGQALAKGGYSTGEYLEKNRSITFFSAESNWLEFYERGLDIPKDWIVNALNRLANSRNKDLLSYHINKIIKNK